MKAANTANAIVDQQDIKNLFLKILKNWYWILIFMIICGVGSYLYLRKATYIYGASTKILVKPQKNALADAMNKSFGMQRFKAANRAINAVVVYHSQMPAVALCFF